MLGHSTCSSKLRLNASKGRSFTSPKAVFPLPREPMTRMAFPPGWPGVPLTDRWQCYFTAPVFETQEVPFTSNVLVWKITHRSTLQFTYSTRSMWNPLSCITKMFTVSSHPTSTISFRPFYHALPPQLALHGNALPSPLHTQGNWGTGSNLPRVLQLVRSRQFSYPSAYTQSQRFLPRHAEARASLC